MLGGSDDRWLIRDPLWDKLWYKIVPIRLNLLRDQSYDLITLQLLSLLYASSNKRIAFKIMALVEKNPLNPMEIEEETVYIQLIKKPP